MNSAEEIDPKNKKNVLIYLTLGILLIALAIFIYWFVWLRFEESTNDAYVNGNKIQVTPQQTGIVTAVFADNTQLVEEGQLLHSAEPHQLPQPPAAAELEHHRFRGGWRLEGRVQLRPAPHIERLHHCPHGSDFRWREVLRTIKARMNGRPMRAPIFCT